MSTVTPPEGEQYVNAFGLRRKMKNLTADDLEYLAAQFEQQAAEPQKQPDAAKRRLEGSA